MSTPQALPVPCEAHPRFLCQFGCPYLPLFFQDEDTPIGRAQCEVRLTNGIDAFVASINRQDREASGRLDPISAARTARAWLERMARFGVLARTDPEKIRRRLARYVRSRAVPPPTVPLESVRVADRRFDPGQLGTGLAVLTRRLVDQWEFLLLTWPDLTPRQQALFRDAFAEALACAQRRLDDDEVPPFLDTAQGILRSRGATADDLALFATLFREFAQRYGARWRS